MSKYSQIYDDLLANITTERLQRGARLPSETQLIDRYQASRGTVRRAIEQLQERGFAQKIHGKGTFVLSPAPLDFQLSGLVNGHETHTDPNNDIRNQVVELTHFALEGPLLQHLEAEPGTLITRIKRIRYITGKRAILDINHFVSSLTPGLDPNLSDQSVYAFLEQPLQLPINYAQRTIAAQPCNNDDQAHLDLDGQSHVIVVTTQTLLHNGRQFEYSESRHTLDTFHFCDIVRR